MGKEAIIAFGMILGTLNLSIDGSSNMKRFGLGKLLITPTRETIWQSITCYFITNNEDEYEAIVAGHELA